MTLHLMEGGPHDGRVCDVDHTIEIVLRIVPPGPVPVEAWPQYPRLAKYFRTRRCGQPDIFVWDGLS